MASQSGPGHTQPARWWLPLALILAGVAALTIAQLTGPAPRGVPTELSTPRAGAEPRGSLQLAARPHRSSTHVADRLRGPHLPASEPVSIRIPTLGLTSPLARLGIAGDGTLEAPRAADEIGWFTGSATPGAVGPAVIAGHVTWDGVPAAFRELQRLRRADRILVRRGDGRTAVFAVTDVERFPKTGFPTRAVYGATDHAAVRLITCGGRFDADQGGYEDNVVAFGRLVAVRR